MEITETFYAQDRDTWRAWLETYHAAESEIWLVYYKKHTGTPSVSYDEAVEEALRADPRAWEAFNALAPSHRRAYIGWIISAKREDTRARRIQEAIQLLQEGKSLRDRG